ncbi:MAG TPA: UDP-N-acetylmuramoyl-tripeptide--D-alanyl-D-alanine ligase [Clostridiaceae bacterium]|nr:UDP-N-acetylmuramoyl-tripeptide--D-alanyl-D-alanine ligase [Clostridiaceae bacterium]
MKSIRVKEIIEQLDATLYGSEDASFDQVVIDTRKVSEGSLFIGIKGERVDGNGLYQEAFDKGASVCIVEDVDVTDVPPGKAVLKVKSTHRGILDLAFLYRQKLKVKVIGITGSTGKTSTKDILHGMLSKKYRVFKTSGNYNNELGLPLMILSLDDDYDYAVLEMGMSAPLEIHNLARVARPDYAIITNIGLSHIEHLGSQENILKAKMEIADFFDKDALLVLNGDDAYLSSIGPKSYKVLYGGLKNGSFVAKNLQLGEEEISFSVNKGKERLTINVAGKHNVQNAILCYIMAKELGLRDEDLAEVSVEKSAMRMDLIKHPHLTVINDCYNASPDSMKAALAYLMSFQGRKVAVLGTMKELGQEEKRSHESLANHAKTLDLSQVIFIGAYGALMASNYGEGAVYFETVEEAKEALKRVLKKGDTVLIKASRSMAFEGLLKELERLGGV